MPCVNYKNCVLIGIGRRSFLPGGTALERGIFRGLLDDEQRAIFAQILNGRTGREIAADLGITPARIEGVVRRTCRQLDAKGRRGAALIIANHYGWKTGQPTATGSGKIAMGSNRSDADTVYHAAKMVQTEREHPSGSVYVRDVGSRVFEKDKYSDAFDETAGRFSILKILAASPNMQRVLLMALLIASSALALGALVSAMQGLDVLMFS